MTTALVRMDVNIDLAIGRIVKGTLKPQNYLLGFKDGGLGLAPYHGFADKISAKDKARIDQLIADIKAGKIKDLPKVQ